MINTKRNWIIGCGDIGRRVASLYHNTNTNTNINGIVSSTESALKCQQLGIDITTIDLDSHYSLSQQNFADAQVFYFVPPPPQGAKDTRLKRFLVQLNAQTPRRVVLISTTGVYGDNNGEWIDETTPVKPQTDRAVRRVSAEQILQRWVQGNHCEFQILRVPGIYAADRLPLARLEKGLPVVNESEAGFSNRIHADDLARACKAAMECESHGHIINVCDGNPSTMTDYFNHVADFAKLPRAPQISLKQAEKILSEGMVSYLKESRRIRNDKLLDVLNIDLLYPSLDSSLSIKNECN